MSLSRETAPRETARRRPRVGLVVDHPRRDLDGLILVGVELARAGASAVLAPLSMSWVDVALADVDAVVLNYARKNNRGQIRWLAEQGRKVFVLDTEGYLGDEKHAMLLDAIRETDTAPWLSGYFVWGQAAGDAVAAADPRLADKVIVTGCPRFDLLSERRRQLLRFERQGYVLLNPNFNGVSPRYSTPEVERANMIAGGWDPDYIDFFLADMRAAMAGFLELCAELPRRLPQLEFVVRPHPFERSEPYAAAIAGLPNAHLNLSGPVFPALAHARRLVHLNCNTSVEGRLVGLAPIQADFLNSDLLRRHLPLYGAVSVPAASLDELCTLLQDDAALAARDDREGIVERWIRPAFHSSDGRAAERVARALVDSLEAPPETLPSAPPVPAPPVPAAERRRRALTVGLSRALGTVAVNRIRALRKGGQDEKRFSLEQVRDLVERVSALDGLPAPRVRRLRSPLTGAPLQAIQIG